MSSGTQAQRVVNRYLDPATNTYKDAGQPASEQTLQDILGALGGGSFALEVDFVGNYIYVGEANPGTAKSASAWRIQRYDTTTGIVGLFADGNSNFDNVWNNHLTLSYS